MGVSVRRTLGRKAEQRALDFLLDQGLVLITRNFSCRFGEIDLVMQDGDCLVYTEVRYRKASGYGSAAASVDRRKQRKLALAASFYITRNRRFAMSPMRFDVVAIDAGDPPQPTISWIRDAFRPDE